jgi:NAD-dependent oxidoreductase involved in siderophore biosynthesis
MTAWEYLIVALPRFELPTAGREPSAAVQTLNAEGELGWEAIGMTVLADESVAVLLKRRLEADDDDADRSLLRRLRVGRHESNVLAENGPD